MDISSRTPDGEDNRCEICGHSVRIAPSRPPGDATCPCCGSLIWFTAPPELLSKACSALNGQLLREDDAPIPLDRPFVLVGRHKSCEIQLTASDASELHCAFSFDRGYWDIRDLKSESGTLVNGQKVTRTVLCPGDKITIAKTKYTISYALPAGDNDSTQ